MKAFMPDQYVQIDVVEVTNNAVMCNLYTGTRCVRIAMAISDYESLQRDKFFIRDGKNRDSAGVLNTTREFYLQKELINH